MSFTLVPGAPCWMEIPATDVSRAKTFYTAVFHWSFQAHPSGVSEDELTLFAFPDKTFPLFGGIRKCDVVSQPKGSCAVVKLFLLVENMEKTMEEIVTNGGRKASEIQPEGDYGFVMDFDDTEGNRFAICMRKKQDC